MQETERFVDVPGGRLIAWHRGRGEPVLVLHGAWTATDYTAPLVETLPRELQTIRYQQRGMPPSTTSGPLTVERHVADAVAVLDAFALERALLIGHSWGGYLALRVAAEHPDRVTGVVALGSLGAHGPDGGLAVMSATFERRMSPEDASALAALGADADYNDALPICWRYYFARPESAPPFPPWLRIDTAASQRLAASVADEHHRGVLAAQLGSISCPVVFVHGAQDPLPLAAAVETAAGIPDATIRVLDGCGHFPWLEDPEAVRAAVTARP